jgi:hypothetical protein
MRHAQCYMMEGLESGPMTSTSSDPLLSAALSTRSPAAHTDDFRDAAAYHALNGRLSPHVAVTAAPVPFSSQYTVVNI